MTKKNKKENYAVARSLFGDYWVGKTFLIANGKSIFPTFDEAIEEAKNRNDSVSNLAELEDTFEEECEMIAKNCEKWIV